MSFSVIILSRNIENVRACVQAVQANEPGERIIVVDDSMDTQRSGVEMQIARFCGSNGVSWRAGEKPFVFARNANLGIEAAGDDDVILLNDDALLETPGGFTKLAEEAAANPDYVISATTNNAGNPNQMPRGVGLRREMRVVAFVCVYIPRKTIERVGLLDPRFTAYGWEDNDYCRRVREAGLMLGIFDGCFVDHTSLKSTFRGEALRAGDISDGRRIYVDKWGDTN